MMPVAPSKTAVIVCPGFHPQAWTDAFLQSVAFPESVSVWIFPKHLYPACSGIHLLNWMLELSRQQQLQHAPILLGFSAGAVATVQAAWAWQQLGEKVAAIIALDGWGVPLPSDIPGYRLSHDFFTHWSSALLGEGCDRFYASPDVTHADLWQVPQQVQGWQVNSNDNHKTRITAAQFIQALVTRHTHT